MLVNQSSKTVKMKKGDKVGRAQPLRTLQPVKLNKKERCVKPQNSIENQELVVPDRVMARIKDLLRPNQDVVHMSDKELGQNITVKMKNYNASPPI